MNDLQWDYILGSDLYPHVQDELRIQGKAVMNERALQWEELWIGMPVYWRRESRGGYGYVEHIIAVVLRLGKKRIGLACLRKDGNWTPAHVALSSLRHREEQA